MSGEGLFPVDPEFQKALHMRAVERSADDPRGDYFRDVTAILHESAFRRMRHKAQVFIAPRNEHVCTRIEHVLHVAGIAVTICKALELDTELAWAISLGHDVGHTPFGHIGESVINELQKTKHGAKAREFFHELHSLRIVDKLANHGRGLNLCYAVRDGIVCHCGEVFEQELRPKEVIKDLAAITDKANVPATWEAVVVRMSDKIAYLGRDLEDAIRIGSSSDFVLPETCRRVLGERNSRIIDSLVRDIIGSSATRGTICFSDEVYEAFLLFKEYNYEHIYKPNNKTCTDYIRMVLSSLWNYYHELYGMYQDDGGAYQQRGRVAQRFGHYVSSYKDFYEKDGWDNVVLDYLAGMTDNDAIENISEVLLPSRFSS